MLQEYQRGWGWVVVAGSLSFDVQGRWRIAQFGPIRADRKMRDGEGGGGGGGLCKNWTIFVDVINVWSRTDFKNGSSFFQIPAKNTKIRNFL